MVGYKVQKLIYNYYIYMCVMFSLRLFKENIIFGGWRLLVKISETFNYIVMVVNYENKILYLLVILFVQITEFCFESIV